MPLSFFSPCFSQDHPTTNQQDQYREAEYFLPASQFPQVFATLCALLEAHKATLGANFVVQLRTCARDGLWLSPFRGEGAWGFVVLCCIAWFMRCAFVFDALYVLLLCLTHHPPYPTIRPKSTHSPQRIGTSAWLFSSRGSTRILISAWRSRRLGCPTAGSRTGEKSTTSDTYVCVGWGLRESTDTSTVVCALIDRQP